MITAIKGCRDCLQHLDLLGAVLISRKNLRERATLLYQSRNLLDFFLCVSFAHLDLNIIS